MNMLKMALCYIISLATTNSLVAQEKIKHRKQSYTEINAGFGFNSEWVNGLKGVPGAALLYGRTHYYKGGFIIDNEIGFALPVLATAKIGAGFAIKKTEFLVGVRILPWNYYAQFNIPTKKGHWVFSAEKLIGLLTIFPTTNFNLGYRWRKS